MSDLAIIVMTDAYCREKCLAVASRLVGIKEIPDRSLLGRAAKLAEYVCGPKTEAARWARLTAIKSVNDEETAAQMIQAAAPIAKFLLAGRIA